VRAIALTVIVALLFGCAASTQQTAINDTLTAVNAASAAFVAFDASHQQSIVGSAADKASGAAALAAWRTGPQAKVQLALTAAYRAVAIAATAVTQPNVDGAISAATQLAALLASLGVKVP
jgi:hypothetical protein